MRSWNWPCISPHTVTGHFCESNQMISTRNIAPLTTGRIKKQASPEIGKAEGYIPLAEHSTPLVAPLLPV